MPAEARKIRAFIALKPPAEWTGSFAELQADLQRHLPAKSFRWTNPDGMHLTLRFLGAILESEAATISERLSEVCQTIGSFKLGVSGLGCFPTRARPRVLWAGLSGELDRLGELHCRIAESTAAFGEKPESRAFAGHLTIARIKEPAHTEIVALGAALHRPFAIDAAWRVREVELIRSQLSPSGSRYETLSVHRLAASI